MEIVYSKLAEPENEKQMADKYASAREWVRSQQIKIEKRLEKHPEVIRLKKLLEI